MDHHFSFMWHEPDSDRAKQAIETILKRCLAQEGYYWCYSIGSFADELCKHEDSENFTRASTIEEINASFKDILMQQFFILSNSEQDVSKSAIAIVIHESNKNFVDFLNNDQLYSIQREVERLFDPHQSPCIRTFLFSERKPSESIFHETAKKRKKCNCRELYGEPQEKHENSAFVEAFRALASS